MFVDMRAVKQENIKKANRDYKKHIKPNNKKCPMRLSNKYNNSKVEAQFYY